MNYRDCIKSGTDTKELGETLDSFIERNQENLSTATSTDSTVEKETAEEWHMKNNDYVNDRTVSNLAKQIIDSNGANPVVLFLPTQHISSLCHWLTVELNKNINWEFATNEEDLVLKLHTVRTNIKKYDANIITYRGDLPNGLPALTFDYFYVMENTSEGLYHGLKLRTSESDMRLHFGLTTTEVSILESLKESQIPVVISGKDLNVVRKVKLLISSKMDNVKTLDAFNDNKALGKFIQSQNSSVLKNPNEQDDNILIEISNSKPMIDTLQKLNKYVLVNVFNRQGTIAFHIKPIINKIVTLTSKHLNDSSPLVSIDTNNNQIQIDYNLSDYGVISPVVIDSNESFDVLLNTVQSRIQLFMLSGYKSAKQAKQNYLLFEVSPRLIFDNLMEFTAMSRDCRASGVFIVIKLDKEEQLDSLPHIKDIAKQLEI